ncbi:hypothetical protein Q5P01_007371 [Channa striata]|uniref:Uncharacterized protein n=1 Tax=Channa striata TaxID=64152 RepID=A0AA88SUS7_CHASR|nr:hypothetical protein Q5P01_007371 [Channa striata]
MGGLTQIFQAESLSQPEMETLNPFPKTAPAVLARAKHNYHTECLCCGSYSHCCPLGFLFNSHSRKRLVNDVLMIRNAHTAPESRMRKFQVYRGTIIKLETKQDCTPMKLISTCKIRHSSSWLQDGLRECILVLAAAPAVHATGRLETNTWDLLS